MSPRHPLEVIPVELRAAVADLPYWFVLDGQAIRCLCPYQPSRDVDFGVSRTEDLDDLLHTLAARGRLEIQERTADTVHLRFEGVKVSVFVLERLASFVDAQRLTVTGILATKLHAIVDRGLRRDFFDLYVVLRQQSLGIAECLSAMRLVFQQEVNDALLLRALTYFDDADREAALPGEGPRDWQTVKEYFWTRVGQLLVPPARELAIERQNAP